MAGLIAIQGMLPVNELAEATSIVFAPLDVPVDQPSPAQRAAGHGHPPVRGVLGGPHGPLSGS